MISMNGEQQYQKKIKMSLQKLFALFRDYIMGSANLK